MDDVFAKRMAGGFLTDNQKAALGPWLDRVPRPRRARSTRPRPTRQGDLRVSRGRLQRLPQRGADDEQPARERRHGGKFKVPSLSGSAHRAPYMHDGCAQTLMDRFVTCGGGNLHGNTSALRTDQLADLVEYLESL